MKKYFLFLSFYLLIATAVQSQTVPGTLSSSATVCVNSNSGVLNLSGQTGNILRWEYSLNGSSLWTTIANTSTSYNYSSLGQTTYFRVIVQAVGFPASASNVVTIKTDAESVGGNVSVLSSTECVGNNSVVTLTGYTGTILNWDYSLNNGITWNAISPSNDSSSIHYLIASTTQFRANVQSGVCPAAISDTIKVTASSATVGGSVNGSTVVCASSNSGVLNATGYTGTILRWETSPSGTSPWTTINSSLSTLSYTNLSTSAYYRTVIKSGNCVEQNSDSAFIDIESASAGGFITGTSSVCSDYNSGNLVLNNYNGSIVQWEYSTDNGTTWNPTPSNTSLYTFSNINQNTDFRVQIVNGTCPAVYSTVFKVTVNPLPVLNFTFTSDCEGTIISFTNSSAGASNYNWDFGDGSSSTIQNPSHAFSSGGNFQVMLVANSATGCFDSLTQTISIFAKPYAGFVAIDTICGLNSVNFTNNSSIASGTINSYAWNFGDNTSDTNLNTTHLYTSSANYTITLTAISDNGCVDSASKIITVSAKPVADFSVANVCKKSAATFSNASVINSGSLTNTWDFGDLQTSTLNSPSHLYSNSGSYNISLIVTSAFGCKDTVVKSVYINEQPDLSIATTNVCLAKTNSFSQVINPSVSNYTLNWTYGDGNTGTGNAPAYSYSTSGTFNVTAALTTDSGCVSTANLIATTFPLPYVSFSFNNVCSVDSAYLTNLSSVSSGSMSYQWDFGNDSTSVISNPVIKYDSAGNYVIQLLCTTDNGCVDSLSKTVIIYAAPVTSFTFSNVCDGSPIQFTNTSGVSPGSISGSNWNFGDNTNSTLVNPSKQYLNYGSYSVNLETTSSNGCKSNLTQSVNVYEGAIANFSFVSQCTNQSTPFTNLTSLISGTYNSQWDFGDTTTSVQNSPNHIYGYDGTKTVKLIVTTNNNCIDSISKFVNVYPIPTLFSGNDTTISKGAIVQLNAVGGASYTWTPPTGLSNPVIGNPIAQPEQTSTYIVYGTTSNGCSSSDTITITVIEDYLLVPYNVLTPNNNGKNDTWIIENIESYPANKISILDEWGVVVFEKENYVNDWEGKNEKGEILPDGTYYYVLSFNDNAKIYKGFVALVRNK
jgi:gliding motility-associated-like protein